MGHANKRRKSVKRKKRRGGRYHMRGKGPAAIAATVLSTVVPEIINLVKSGAGSQGGRSAGSRAAYSRFGWPPRGRY